MTGSDMPATTPRTLVELLSLMQSDAPSVVDVHGQWRSDLPTFGGPPPRDTTAVWSWDEDSVIVGTCGDDLAIEPRDGPLTWTVLDASRAKMRAT